MQNERPLDTALKDALINNVPFMYAHLIKFERPARPDANGKISTSKERYTYLTDASRDLRFNDGSTNLIGVANGEQKYLANKVLKVGSVSEQTQATPSNCSLVLDGNGIGAYAEATVNITIVNSTTWDIEWPVALNLVDAGFREGDKIAIAGAATGNYNIVNFRANNTLRVSKVDESVLTAATGIAINISLSSEEIKSILLDKTTTSYASFVNREVFIYRGYYSDDGVIGSPVLIFKGIISSVGFDDTENNIKVTWGLTSHWGDFSQVRGRITSDDFHRALNQNGIPQPQSALKTSYAYDKGFSHAETSLNVLATYSVQIEKQEVKAKNGFLGLGIGAKVKVRTYYVNEDRNTKLDLQLQAKSIPVVYGVRPVPGLPIFADTLNNSSSTVYVAAALSEGEIGGIYDAYINGNSLICNDKSDFDARSQQTADNTVELVCRGRADRGDVLGGVTSTNPSTVIDYYDGEDYLINDFYYNYTATRNYAQYVQPNITNTDTTGKGIVAGESIQLTSPQKITIDFFSGKPGQRASSQLVEIAKANNFKVQNSYWSGTDTTEYWGPNHRLLDTAYVVIKYIIEEGETSIPEIEFIVKGKSIECYNYDYSYSHYSKAVGESEANFSLGDIVTLYDMADVSLDSVQIIDKWTFVNTDGTPNVRFRFSVPPNLNYVNSVPSKTKFYMKNVSNQTWTMVTYNYEEYNGTVGSTIIAPVTNVVTSGTNVALTYNTNTLFGSSSSTTIDGEIPLTSLVLSDAVGDESPLYLYNDLYNSNRILAGKVWTSTQYTSQMSSSTLIHALEAYNNENLSLVSRNTVVLGASASAVDNYYKGYYIELTRYNASKDKLYSQTKLINGYVGSSKTINIEDIWDADFYPIAGDTVIIYPPYRDTRTSINPAIQTLDYVTSKTYGKGLDVVRDINLTSWLDTARVCDTQSTVTVGHTNVVSPAVGKIYKYPASGSLIWQGTVSATDGSYTEFESVLGKLSNAWNSWKSYKVNEFVYSDNRLYLVTSGGIKATQPVHTSGTTSGLQHVGTGTITLTSTNGGPNLTLAVDGNPIRALKNGATVPGYSLYDCDEVNYWRYLGWDEFSQRHVTLHQTNVTIDTSQSLFENTNSLLEHFGGIIRYSGGQYYLDIETLESVISSASTEPRNITTDHIMGKLRLSDDGTKTAFNSLTAAFADPANKFESRNISFFNSDYLKTDRNVPKKGNLSIPGITNYYNTRLLANKFLNKSRFGLTVAFNMAPRGLLLLSGTVIQLQYPRYSWVDKKFRIISLTHQEDCSVDIVAEEYDDSFYNLSKISKQVGSGATGVSTITTIGPPAGLIATNQTTGDETPGGIKLSWVNNAAVNAKNVYTEIYSSYSDILNITVDSVASNVLTATVPHGLVVGEQIHSNTTLNNLVNGRSYFIKATPSTTTFTLSENKDGSVFGLTDGTSLGISMRTASLVATLSVPINSYLDPYSSNRGQVTKYYWVRHKVIKA